MVKTKRLGIFRAVCFLVSLYLFFCFFVFVVWAVVSFPSREIATLALAMTRGGLCAVLATIHIISFPGDVSTAFHSAQHDTWWFVRCTCTFPYVILNAVKNPAVRRSSLR